MMNALSGLLKEAGTQSLIKRGREKEEEERRDAMMIAGFTDEGKGYAPAEHHTSLLTASEGALDRQDRGAARRSQQTHEQGLLDKQLTGRNAIAGLQHAKDIWIAKLNAHMDGERNQIAYGDLDLRRLHGNADLVLRDALGRSNIDLQRAKILFDSQTGDYFLKMGLYDEQYLFNKRDGQMVYNEQMEQDSKMAGLATLQTLLQTQFNSLAQMTKKERKDIGVTPEQMTGLAGRLSKVGETIFKMHEARGDLTAEDIASKVVTDSAVTADDIADGEGSVEDKDLLDTAREEREMSLAGSEDIPSLPTSVTEGSSNKYQLQGIGGFTEPAPNADAHFDSTFFSTTGDSANVLDTPEQGRGSSKTLVPTKRLLNFGN